MANDKQDISALRTDYTAGQLDQDGQADTPWSLWEQWLAAALEMEVMEPNAFTLSTVGADGTPHGRIVLLRQSGPEGFMFYTNYESNKGQELTANPKAAATFFWPELQRQVRVEGTVSRVSEEQSDRYFASRPRGSRIGAWSSPQSRKLSDRSDLEEAVTRYEKQFEDAEVTRPKHWGGFCISPRRIEFWQGRASRLHDRLVYEKVDDVWQLSRLAP